MRVIDERKRAAYRRRLRIVLHEILNDSTVMPNADCRDLVVSVEAIEFGATVREIFVDFSGHWKQPDEAAGAHARYLAEAAARGEDTYVDLTDVAVFPSLMDTVAAELQRRLGLTYRPTLRQLCEGWRDPG